MKQYDLNPSISAVICTKCGNVMHVLYYMISDEERRRRLTCPPPLPIDFEIKDDLVSFHCNHCNNEDDFEIEREELAEM